MSARPSAIFFRSLRSLRCGTTRTSSIGATTFCQDGTRLSAVGFRLFDVRHLSAAPDWLCAVHQSGATGSPEWQPALGLTKTFVAARRVGCRQRSRGAVKVHMQAGRALNKKPTADGQLPTADCGRPRHTRRNAMHSLDIHTPSHIAEMLRQDLTQSRFGAVSPTPRPSLKWRGNVQYHNQAAMFEDSLHMSQFVMRKNNRAMMRRVGTVRQSTVIGT